MGLCCLTQWTNNLTCCVLCQAFRELDELATSHTDRLRKLTKLVQEHRQSHDDEGVKTVVEEYDETLEWYVTVSSYRWSDVA